MLKPDGTEITQRDLDHVANILVDNGIGVNDALYLVKEIAKPDGYFGGSLELSFRGQDARFVAERSDATLTRFVGFNIVERENDKWVNVGKEIADVLGVAK